MNFAGGALLVILALFVFLRTVKGGLADWLLKGAPQQ